MQWYAMVNGAQQFQLFHLYVMHLSLLILIASIYPRAFRSVLCVDLPRRL